MKLCLVTVASLVALTPVFLVAAQTLPCGDIIAPENWRLLHDRTKPLQSTVIENCDDPFLKTDDLVGLNIEGLAVDNGQLIEIPTEGTSNYRFGQESSFYDSEIYYFKHEGTRYQYFDTSYSKPSDEQIAQTALDFFEIQTDADTYVNMYRSNNPDVYFYDEEGQDIVDVTTGDSVASRYYQFVDYLQAHLVTDRPKLTVGTYTAVTVYSPPVLNFNSDHSLIKRILAMLIPTAHAIYISPDEVSTVTFTLKAAEPVSTGVSSVLFLPGIQASRLYSTGGGGAEDQIWEPNLLGGDVAQLEMTSGGVSVHNIYTRDVIDTNSSVGDVYAGFIQFLRSEKDTTHHIKDYTLFPYDWRYDVHDVAVNGTKYQDGVKKLVDEVVKLSGRSFSEKVTIIAHSNGGLVAKELLIELERLGKTNLIDKIIFIGTPQLGTPKALGTILHGYDQTDDYGGIVLDGAEVRAVTNNMPGAYGLLPSEKYFEGLSEPLVYFGTSSLAVTYRDHYGNSISTSVAKYKEFLLGTEGEIRNLDGLISAPAKANELLFNRAFDNHRNQLDNWVAPAGVNVIEIVGTGLPTMKSIEYREIIERPRGCYFPFCSPRNILKPFAHLTKYGDRTVVQGSAEAYVGAKRKFFVNILAANANSSNDVDYEHYNLTEIPQLQDLISAIIIASTTDNIDFISTNYIAFNDEYDEEIIDSPVRMLAEDTIGRKTGVVIENGTSVIKEEIPGSQYFELGDTKYLIIPKNVQRTTTLYGQDTGSYSLTLARLKTNDVQEIQHSLLNATVTPQMIVTYSKTDDVYSSVKTDINGDGTIDSETTVDGILVKYTYADLRLVIKSLKLPKSQDMIIIQLVNLADQASKQKIKYPIFKPLEKIFLKQVSDLLEQFKKKKLITQSQLDFVRNMIINIIN